MDCVKSFNFWDNYQKFLEQLVPQKVNLDYIASFWELSKVLYLEKNNLIRPFSTATLKLLQ